jgi:hypothetical protein
MPRLFGLAGVQNARQLIDAVPEMLIHDQPAQSQS